MLKSLIVAAVLVFSGVAYAEDGCITRADLVKANGTEAQLVDLTKEQVANLKANSPGFPADGSAVTVGTTAESAEVGRVAVFVFNDAGCGVGAKGLPIAVLKKWIEPVGDPS